MEDFSYLCGMKTIAKKYSVNERFFDKIETEYQAYFLGLMASDGCITDENKLLIGLAREDEQVLKLFKHCINYTGPLYLIAGRTVKHKDQTRLQIRNKTLFEDLKKHGITERKSLTLKFPELKDDLIPHFIRGYFDGDGSVKFNHGVIRVQFVGTYEFLFKLQSILMEKCELSAVKMYQANKAKNTFDLTYGGDTQVMRIYDYLYNGTFCFMQRKKDKFDNHWKEKFKSYPTSILYEELDRRDAIPDFD